MGNLKTMDRRSFLIDALKLSGQIALASTAIYSVSFVTKEKSGILAHGAKIGRCMCKISPTDGGCATRVPHWVYATTYSGCEAQRNSAAGDCGPCGPWTYP